MKDYMIAWTGTKWRIWEVSCKMELSRNIRNLTAGAVGDLLVPGLLHFPTGQVSQANGHWRLGAILSLEWAYCVSSSCLGYGRLVLDLMSGWRPCVTLSCYPGLIELTFPQWRLFLSRCCIMWNVFNLLQDKWQTWRDPSGTTANFQHAVGCEIIRKTWSMGRHLMVFWVQPLHFTDNSFGGSIVLPRFITHFSFWGTFNSKKIGWGFWVSPKSFGSKSFQGLRNSFAFWVHIPRAFSFGPLWSEIIVVMMYLYITAALANHSSYLLVSPWVSLWVGLSWAVLLMLSPGVIVVGTVTILPKMSIPNPWC